MKKLTLHCLCLAAALNAAGAMEFQTSGNLKVAADEIVADHRSDSFAATGKVDVACHPYRLMSESVAKDGDKTTFGEPTVVTTCTNDVDHLHWSMTGEAEYFDGKYILGRNQVLRMFGLPLFWLPYWYYPIGGVEGLRMMPGYTGRWGGYLLTKYIYHVAGDRTGAPDAFSLRGASRVDLRTKNGVALGQSFDWQLGEYGKGYFKAYYAHDNDYDRYTRNAQNLSKYNYGNWGSEVDRNRYALELDHAWDVTERDMFRMHAKYLSDSFFQYDFLRDSLLGINTKFSGSTENEGAWEHIENGWAAGVSVYGRLNDFYDSVARLPEFYFDFNPTPLWNTGVNYESQTKIGYLRRNPAVYGKGVETNPFAYNPGVWATYGTFRLDTYHRLTYPMKFWDVMSVVPRLAYHGTYYGDTGYEHAEKAYFGKAGKTGNDAFRSIFEGGVTFSARGTAWMDDEWQSVIEPYADVLLQEAWISGISDGKRLYMFDSIDGSRDWLDQFAGRGRNLPYTYYGVTPGFRKLFRRIDERGNLHTVFDFDFYAAMQFGGTKWNGTDKNHRLAKLERANYGEHSFTIVPGVRTRWMPTDDTMLGLWAEYDSENNTIAMADVEWRQAINKRFNYYAQLSHRDHRWWDYASSPTDARVNSERFNWASFSILTVGYEHELITETIVYSPYTRWNLRDHDLESIGSWIDYRTDCLGFRFIVAYDSEYTRIDGSRYKDDWRFGFFVYLRALGPEMGDSLKY